MFKTIGNVKKAFVFLLVISVFTSCGEDEAVTPTSPSPIADFSFQLDSYSPGRVMFTNTSKNATSYEWSFGEGEGTSTEKSPSYTFSSNGSYEVTLVAKGKGNGLIREKRVEVKKTIEVTNSSPLTARMEGASVFDFVASSITARNLYDGLVIRATGSSSSESTTYLQITLPQDISMGTYYLYDNYEMKMEYITSSSSWAASAETYCSSGSITITEASSTHLKGQFSGELYNDDCSGYFVIHSGNFYVEL